MLWPCGRRGVNRALPSIGDLMARPRATFEKSTAIYRCLLRPAGEAVLVTW